MEDATIPFCMANDILLTRQGYEKLQKELEDLKGPTRMRVAEAIREAKAHGDLRENAAYHEAKLNQTRLESRIAELEKTLQIAKVVDRDPAREGYADLGSKIKLLDVDFDDEFEVQLVGDFEGDPDNNFVSISSPLGSALSGKQKGETVKVIAPAGEQIYKILSVD